MCESNPRPLRQIKEVNKRKIKGEACGNRTYDLLGRFKEENKRKIKGEACGNRTHDLLGRFKKENKMKIKIVIPLPHSQLEIDKEKLIKQKGLWGFDSITPRPSKR